MRVLIAGDTHANSPWVCDYLNPRAARHDVDAVVQLGDFGYWEHGEQGVAFLDDVSEAAGCPWYFLRGNHDKLSLLLERYDNAAHRTADGFLQVRDNVLFIPDGHHFSWDTLTFRAFGGAYSIDKLWRLEQETRRSRVLAAKEEALRRAGAAPRDVPSTAGTLWFPEEQLTDAQMDAFLAQPTPPVDVILSHDKPRSAAAPGLKDELECLPNQDRLQRALRHHRPAWWLHGHLHHRSDQEVPCGDQGEATRVLCLSCDDRAAGRFWRPTDAWGLLEWQPGEAAEYTSGADAEDAWKGVRRLDEAA